MGSNSDFNARALQEGIQRLAGTFGVTNVKMFDAVVTSVNVKERSCVVDSSDTKLNITGLTVRLLPEISDGDLNIPSVDENIIVAFSDFLEPFVVKTSWIDKKIIIVGNQGWYIENEKQVFNNERYGGIPIVKDLKSENAGLLAKIKNLEEKLNKVNDRLDSFIKNHLPPKWVVTPNDGGAALQTAITTWISTPDGLPVSNISPLTKESDISNPNIFHGDKLKEDG